jgi:predicted RNA-binding protein YlqC (UPF0109 family)
MTDTAVDVRALIEHIAKAIVDEPAQVVVEPGQDEDGKFLELEVAPNDLGKVIGRGGRTARALRNILAAACTKLDDHVELEIIEPEEE